LEAAKLTSIFILLSFACFAQKEYKVMDWKTEYTLNTYLVQQMKQQYAERSRNFTNALRSKDSLLAYAKNVRQKFRELIGPLPPVSPLNATITGTNRREDYTIYNLVYESFPNHHVTANLYIPYNARKPMPAVLFFCGHEDAAKATESYQLTALQLVQEGFAVMVIDPISQSERYQLTDSTGKPFTRGGTTEHTLINETANLVGSSAAAYELWDNVRGLDYLVTRPEIDTSRIGCMGNSGGAIQAIYFAAFEPRVKVIVPCSYLSSRERTLELSGPADGCAQIPSEGKALLEMGDYLIAAAPKPILVLAGRYDFIDYEGTVNAFNDLKQVYKVLDEPAKLKLFTYDDGHGISAPKRLEAAAWFNKWLRNDTSQVKAYTSASNQHLTVTLKGQVNAEYPNEVTVFARNKMLADVSRQFKKPTATDALPVQVTATGEQVINGVRYIKSIIRKQGEPPFPMMAAWPAIAKKIVLWFPDRGKHTIIDSAGLVQSLLNQNAAVIICDVRGTGETEDKAEFNDPKYFNREYRNAMLALHIGDPLVMQRARDIITAVQWLRENKLPIEIHASGHVALAALHAALFVDVKELHLYSCIPSFKDILNNPLQKDWYSWVIPGVLKYYDIPDLVKLIGEDKVRFVK